MVAFHYVGGADDRMFFAPVRAATRADKEKLATTPTVGVKVMAPWTNGKLYPGKVDRVMGDKVSIKFDDGDKREGVAWTACTARATGTVSLHEAIRRKDLQAVKKCIESGRDVNVKGPDGNYPLASAAHDGLTEIVDALLVAGSEVNKQAATGATALHYAAFRGHAACVRRLVDAGADVHLEAWNAPPLTPLESAISHKRTAVVRILAPLTKDLHAAKKAENAAADPKDVDLFEAVRIGDVAALQRGCVGLIDVRNGEQETLLHKACLYDHLANQAKVVEVLLAAGIDKDATRDGGWTALHLCAEHDQRACAKLLLAAGADASVRGSNGMTALRIAEVCGNTKIAKLFREPRPRARSAAADPTCGCFR